MHRVAPGDGQDLFRYNHIHGFLRYRRLPSRVPAAHLGAATWVLAINKCQQPQLAALMSLFPQVQASSDCRLDMGQEASHGGFDVDVWLGTCQSPDMDVWLGAGMMGQQTELHYRWEPLVPAVAQQQGESAPLPMQ